MALALALISGVAIPACGTLTHELTLYTEPSVASTEVEIETVAIVPNRLPMNLANVPFWQRRNAELLRDRFVQQGYRVIDLEVAEREFKRIGLPVEDTSASRDKLAELAGVIGADVIAVPYYGTFTATSHVVIKATVEHVSVSTLQFYLARSNDFFARIDASGTDSYSTGWGMVVGMGAIIGSMFLEDPDIRTAAIVAGAGAMLVGTVIDTIEATVSHDTRWGRAFDAGLEAGLSEFFKRFPPTRRQGRRPDDRGRRAHVDTHVPPPREAPAPPPVRERPALRAPAEQPDPMAKLGTPSRVIENRRAKLPILAGHVAVPAGEFVIGSPDSEVGRKGDEARTLVKITRSFWIKETEVTQAEWLAVLGSNPSRVQDCGDDCPVENVSWLDTIKYLNAISVRDGLPPCYSEAGAEFKGLDCLGYRLPTEAEWEVAARAGDVGVRPGPTDEVAWHEGNSEARKRPVRSRAPNAWGLYDMLGNVWEWTYDLYAVERPTDTVVDPTGAKHGRARTLRGGGWDSPSRHVRNASRRAANQGSALGDVGFRPARTIP